MKKLECLDYMTSSFYQLYRSSPKIYQSWKSSWRSVANINQVMSHLPSTDSLQSSWKHFYMLVKYTLQNHLNDSCLLLEPTFLIDRLFWPIHHVALIRLNALSFWFPFVALSPVMKLFLVLSWKLFTFSRTFRIQMGLFGQSRSLVYSFVWWVKIPWPIGSDLQHSQVRVVWYFSFQA